MRCCVSNMGGAKRNRIHAVRILKAYRYGTLLISECPRSAVLGTCYPVAQHVVSLNRFSKRIS